jgi:hypothetical protein
MISITDTDLEDILKSLLQKNVNFVINKKKWRTGRVLLFKQNGFFVEITLKNNKEKIERFEIPIPFDITKNNNSIKFSYKLDALICNNPQMVSSVKK